MPKASSFYLLARFSDEADDPPDRRFTPPADTATPFAGTTGSSAGYGGATDAPATSPTAASAAAFVAASLLAVSYSTDILALIASMAKSTCAIHA